MSKELQDNVILITGASKGIGRALALELACNEGAHVVACARSFGELQALKAECEAISIHLCDVSRPETMDALFSHIKSEYGRLDIVVNNASILGPTTSVREIDEQKWQKVVDVNLNGSFYIAKRSLPLLDKSVRKPGVVLNMSSSVGRKTRAQWGAYSVSKYGLEGLSHLISTEEDPRAIISVTLNPGGTATQMRAEAYPDEDPATLPSARKVAQSAILLMKLVGAEQTGAQYSSRALFDFLERDEVSVSDLPTDN